VRDNFIVRHTEDNTHLATPTSEVWDFVERFALSRMFYDRLLWQI